MNKIFCSVRFDDICPTMDWEQFNKAITLMDKYGIKPLLGIIPDNSDPNQNISPANDEFWEKMVALQSRGYEIALHGCYHVFDSKKNGIVTPWGIGSSEFAGNSYQNQYKKIERGKSILESHGLQTDLFFAPAHSYDKATLKALYNNGFRFISDGKSSKPYIQEGIKCIPCTFFGVPKKEKRGINIAICHTNRWSEYPENYNKLVAFCERNKNNFVPYSELKQLKAGNYLVQKLEEKAYLIMIDLIRRRLSYIGVLSSIYQKTIGKVK